MPRVQTYLTEQELELLDRAEDETGASRSELIRRAVRRVYGEADADARLASLRQAKGIWADRPFTGAEYVDALRSGWSERLQRLFPD
jgi:Arc/MetJ-type ribon-helix-helix transcriptional regulator